MGFVQCMKQDESDFEYEDVDFEGEDVVIQEMKSLKNLSLNVNNNCYDRLKITHFLNFNNNSSQQFDEKNLLEKKNMEKLSEKLSTLDSFAEEVIQVIPLSRKDGDDDEKYLQRLHKFGGLITALSVVRKLIAKHRREINVDMEMLNNH
uniref:Uncharacterized protein n=1 Tax=Cannabis sativa TaxID=3483 RepID=A0A803NFF0_CANSA